MYCDSQNDGIWLFIFAKYVVCFTRLFFSFLVCIRCAFSVWPHPDHFIHHYCLSHTLLEQGTSQEPTTKKKNLPEHIILVQIPVSNPSIYSWEHQRLSLTSYFKQGTSPPACCRLWSLPQVDSSLLCKGIHGSDENLLLHPYRHPADIWASLVPVRIFRQMMGHLNWSRTVFEKAKPRH